MAVNKGQRRRDRIGRHQPAIDPASLPAIRMGEAGHSVGLPYFATGFNCRWRGAFALPVTWPSVCLHGRVGARTGGPRTARS